MQNFERASTIIVQSLYSLRVDMGLSYGKKPIGVMGARLEKATGNLGVLARLVGRYPTSSFLVSRERRRHVSGSLVSWPESEQHTIRVSCLYCISEQVQTCTNNKHISIKFQSSRLTFTRGACRSLYGVTTVQSSI